MTIPWQSGGALETHSRLSVLRDRVSFDYLQSSEWIKRKRASGNDGVAGTGICVTAPLSSVQDFLNWGKATVGWDVPEQGGPHFAPRMKVGEFVPGHTDTVVVPGIGSMSPWGTDYPSLGGKISSRLRRQHPWQSQGGWMHRAQELGAGGWKGAEEGIEALK